jgi:hypothetical protein
MKKSELKEIIKARVKGLMESDKEVTITTTDGTEKTATAAQKKRAQQASKDKDTIVYKKQGTLEENQQFLRMQKLAGLITEDRSKKKLEEVKIKNPSLKIKNKKDEALNVLEEFIEEFKPMGLFEFIPDLEHHNINNNTNSLHVEELGSVYLISNNESVSDEIKDIIISSGDGEFNENGITWKKYHKKGYYYIVAH